MKKRLSLFLAVCLMLTLLPAALGVAETASEATHIRLFRTSSRPTNELTDLTRQYMIDNLGVDVELIMGSTDWKQQLALFITSGDIPDIMAFMDMNTFLSYAQEGVFLDVTDQVDNYPNIRRYISTAGDYDALIHRTTLDGRILGLPSVTIARSYYVTNIRVDWLEKFGLDIPTTLDEYTQAMRKFALEDPDGNGAKDT
ncbi:MAG TPA: extracellular solute-binding protein, partial [Clostridia bacterium]|nr:extracellular solute-binding protein [Clostridia bacterium]